MPRRPPTDGPLQGLTYKRTKLTVNMSASTAAPMTTTVTEYYTLNPTRMVGEVNDEGVMTLFTWQSDLPSAGTRKRPSGAGASGTEAFMCFELFLATADPRFLEAGPWKVSRPIDWPYPRRVHWGLQYDQCSFQETNRGMEERISRISLHGSAAEQSVSRPQVETESLDRSA